MKRIIYLLLLFPFICFGHGALLGGEVKSLLDIPWGTNTYFLKIELDIENNGSYMDFGTQQFMSVPYALYAESSRELQENVDQNEINSYTADSGLQSQIIELQAELDVNQSNLNDLIMSLQNSLDSINTPISNYHFSRTISYSSELDYSGSVSSIIDSIYIKTGGLIFVSASMYASVAISTNSASVSLGLQDVNGNAISLNSIQSFSTSVNAPNNAVSSEKICIGNFVSQNNQMIYIVGNYSCGGYNNHQNQGGNSGGFDVMLYR